VTTISTVAKGQSPADNAIVSTDVTGNIIGAAGLGSTVNRIPVCAGTDVSTVTTDTSGNATVISSSAGVSCDALANCTISSISQSEKYTVQSQNGGRDRDSLTFLPE
jgi:hypothetical protein